VFDFVFVFVLLFFLIRLFLIHYPHMSSTTSLRSALPFTRLGTNTHKYLLRSSTNRGISTTPLHPLLRTSRARQQQKTSLSIHPSSRTTQLPIIASIFK